MLRQPRVADIFFGDSLLAEQGLLSRALVTAPDTAAGTRFWREEQPETEQHIKRYGARLLSILERPLPLREGTRNELEPRRLTLSDGSRRAWIEYSKGIEREIRPNGELEAIRGLANKLPEHAGLPVGKTD